MVKRCKKCKTELTYNESRWNNGLCDECDNEDTKEQEVKQ